MATKHWAGKAFKNANKPAGTPGSTKGALHRELNVSQDQTIPKEKLLAAARGRYGKLAKKRALPVVNIEK